MQRIAMGSAWWANRSFAAMADARARLEVVRKRLAERRASELEMFAGRVAHDLRNPLAAIALRVALAQRDIHDPGRVQTCLRRVTTVIEHATQMIDGLLDFARAGGATDPTAHVDACHAVRSVLDDLEPEIDDAGITATTEMPTGAELHCSPGALLSVLGNLVRNAIKYATHDGDGHITIRVVEMATCVRVEVEDTGPASASGWRRSSGSSRPTAATSACIPSSRTAAASGSSFPSPGLSSMRRCRRHTTYTRRRILFARAGSHQRWRSG